MNESVARVAADEPVTSDQQPLAVRPPEFVTPVRTALDRRTALSLLLRSLDKPSDGAVSRHVHRPISKRITRHLLRWPITPTGMTLFAAGVGVAGVAAAYRGGYSNLVIGALLFELQNILDGCDGEIARLKHLRSRAGEWLDQVIDDVLNVAFLAAVGLALARAHHGYAWPLTVAAIVAQVVHLVGLYAGLIVKAGGRGNVATLKWWIGDAIADADRRSVGDSTRRDFLSLAYVVCALLNGIAAAFVWHAAVMIGSAIVTTFQWIAWGGPEIYADVDGSAEPAPDPVA